MFSVLLFITLISCALMTGLVMFVNWVHYPAFEFIDEQKFSRFHYFHTSRTGILAGIFMLLELISAVFLPIFAESKILMFLSLIALFLVFYIWYETIVKVVPVHNKLSNCFNRKLIHKLVKLNKRRTYAWIFRLLLLFLIVIIFVYLKV